MSPANRRDFIPTVKHSFICIAVSRLNVTVARAVCQYDYDRFIRDKTHASIRRRHRCIFRPPPFSRAKTAERGPQQKNQREKGRHTDADLLSHCALNCAEYRTPRSFSILIKHR